MANTFSQPLEVLPTRVRRTYRGGSLIDRWHGVPNADDSDRPEEWLASVTRAVNPGFPPIENEGLSRVQFGGKEQLLLDVFEAAEEAMLGSKHIKQYGRQLGMLAKLIDSSERLSIQVHPDKPFAKRYFHSDYGKTECWYILGTRRGNGQEPYLLMGFRPGITKEYWHKLYVEQDIEGMVACLNKVTPKPGDTFFIPGGLPHAIGPGCFLLEIQEPTDYTLRSECTRQDGTPIPEQLIHQGLGEKLLMECFHYVGMTEEQLDARCRLQPKTLFYSMDGSCTLLVGEDVTPCFSIQRIICNQVLDFKPTGASILVVLEGEGELLFNQTGIALVKGSRFFLPAGVKHFTLHGKPQLDCIRCYPPGAVLDVPE
ncbi:type I phosphomannose isomerase catalytic subunit [Ktedonobacter racemifer]|uniref:Phosphohexomutase n=1 Tax=Ktedonobacter racemifer DSM 44963 TaxID=485913 RepID=D6U706_KTERA|nr:type I phosphomannose isomerase catalytic subunit [Ktedonobacter racemifer]EFH79667.1 phosphomannose isomerase-like protein [Ktedonobacter racemifer DSM 44963]